MDIDMSQFAAIFVEEAQEHLQQMEAALLALRIDTATSEELNGIFRAAHSIKGGSATFGLNQVTELAHVLESLLDKLRDRRLALTREMVDALLQGADLMGAQIAEYEGRGSVDGATVEHLCDWVRRLTDAGPTGAPAPEGAAPQPTESPLDAPLDAVAPLAPVAPPPVAQATPPAALATSKAAAPKRSTAEGVAFGFFDDEPVEAPAADAAAAMKATPPAPPPAPPLAVATAAMVALPVQATPIAPIEPAPASRPAPQAQSAAHHESNSIRVSVEKVDQIINLVSELVITQSMLAQYSTLDTPRMLEKLRFGLDQLDRNTRGLQEAAMAIRMLPISAVFNRFPRVVRDVAARLGKEVELKLIGEGTELDKGLIERIVDPLTHLVRNSLDHGIEPPAERIALGKPASGTITLRASHQGGNIVIEVSDDGRGLSRERILAKARERGIAVGDNPTDAEVWNLIFEAGFSTAAEVTDVSGRGVGMDVVRSNIVGLGGRVDIQSEAGRGTRMTVRLPLTLAIVDGMSVSCGGETFIIPLAFIVESLRPTPEAVKTVNGSGRVLQIRGKYLPVVALHELMGIPGATQDEHEGILVVLETEEARLALFVDALLGQHQVVIKSLETNFRKVAGVSGATIMGDGRVALILDAAGLGRLAAHRVRLAEAGRSGAAGLAAPSSLPSFDSHAELSFT